MRSPPEMGRAPWRCLPACSTATPGPVGQVKAVALGAAGLAVQGAAAPVEAQLAALEVPARAQGELAVMEQAAIVGPLHRDLRAGSSPLAE